nr:reverse transcriptase domain-containing protein [Tanacetum cinerariifolium]
NPTPYYDLIVSTTSSTLTPFKNSDFLLKEVDAFLALKYDPSSPEVDQSYVDTKGDILLIEAFLNDDPSLPPPNKGNYLPQFQKELKICETKTDKYSIDEPPEVELKDLPPHLEYTFLEGNDKLPVIIAKYLSVEEKTALITVLKSHKVNLKIHDVIKNEVLKLLDARLIYPISNSPWEKSHFMVKEGIFLGHKISKNGIEVDKAKVDVITKLPHPTTVKGIHSSLGHAGFYQRFIQDFLKIARPMNRLLKKDTPFLFSKECVEAFQTLKRKLTKALILISPDWDKPFELMCDASDFAIGAVLGQHQEKHFRPIHYAMNFAIKLMKTLIYKEKTKRLHDSKIKDRVFNIGDRVLLFNSRLKILSGKLKSYWSGPFTISHVFPYCTVELSQPDGPNFKVNGHRLKHYFGEDIPKMVVPDLQIFLMDQ